MELEPLDAFLAELKANNDKAWMDENRARYAALRDEFVELVDRVIAGVAEVDPEVRLADARNAVFRINRDIRFAADKSPYKTNFSAAISPGGRSVARPLYYVQLGADESIVAGGLYFPESALLHQVRQYIARHPRKADALLRHPELARRFGGLDTERMLVRMPRGYDAGSELLRYRSFTVSAPLATLSGDPTDEIVDSLRAMKPLIEWLRAALRTV